MKIKAATLEEDYKLYPRDHVDVVSVNHIADAMKAGKAMPPIVVWRQGNRIIDGFHRRRAAMKLNKAATIEAIFKDYDSEKEAFLDACRFNAAHGTNLTASDRVRCALFAKDFGISQAAIADALSITAARLKDLTTDRVGVLRVAKLEDGTEIPLKYPVKHMAGQVLTVGQKEAMQKVNGSTYPYLVNRLIDAIENDMFDLKDKNLFLHLKKLHKMLGRLLR
jgi:hypothetical protein